MLKTSLNIKQVPLMLNIIYSPNFDQHLHTVQLQSFLDSVCAQILVVRRRGMEQSELQSGSWH